MPDAAHEKSFGERSREAAQMFLRNVLLLDDLIGEAPSAHAKASAEEVSQPDPSAVGADLPTNENVPAGEAGNLDSRKLVQSFAKLGILCAPLVPDVHGPEGEEAFVESVAQAAERADILVLDWWMSRERNWDQFQLSEKVLGRVLKGDEAAGGKLRLVAVYTAEEKLTDILERVRAVLEEHYDGQETSSGPTASSPGALGISKGPVRLVVVNKGNTPGSSEFVSETELASFLVDEYANLTRGLLRHVALQGLTALRERAHQVLAAFDPAMDPAFLCHRALLTSDNWDEGSVVETLGAELLSILEERFVGAELPQELINSWLIDVAGSSLGKVPGLADSNGPAIEAWQKLLEEGVSQSSFPSLTSNSAVRSFIRSLRNGATEALIPEKAGVESEVLSDRARTANYRFASLMQNKNVYRKDPPFLTLGTVLRLDSEGKYLLCLQPKCDSVRLKGETPFPLLALVSRKESEQFDLVMLDGKDSDGIDKWVCLEVQPKTQNLVLPEFEPDPDTRVVWATTQGGQHLFSDTKGLLYRWVGTMKDEHALRVVGRFASNLARPGPNDSEWLRLNAPRN